MDNKSEALKQFATFMAQRCKQELLDECQPNTPRIIDKISSDSLASIYGYHDCPEWERYVIDLDKEIPPDAFSHDNPLYRHTLRIFKVGTESPVFGIEKPQRTCPASSELRDTFKQAARYAKQHGIVLKYRSNTADDIYFIQENGQVKVKVAYFSLLPDGGNTDE